MKPHDLETLSAYLDGQLSPSEAKRLEERIHSDSELRGLLSDLRFGRAAVKQVPRRRVPRNFVLRPSMPGLRGPVPTAVPVLRFASVLATLLLVATFAINGLATRAQATPAAAPLPAYGVGGAGGAAPSPEALLQSNAAQAPAEGQDTMATTSPQQPIPPTAQTGAEAVPKAAPPPVARNAPRAAPTSAIPAVWQILLGAVAALSAALAWYAYRASRRHFTSRSFEK